MLHPSAVLWLFHTINRTPVQLYAFVDLLPFNWINDGVERRLLQRIKGSVTFFCSARQMNLGLGWYRKQQNWPQAPCLMYPQCWMDKLSIRSRDCHESPHSRTKFTLAVWLIFSTPTGKTTDNGVVKFSLMLQTRFIWEQCRWQGKGKITLKDAFVQLWIFCDFPILFAVCATTGLVCSPRS